MEDGSHWVWWLHDDRFRLAFSKIHREDQKTDHFGFAARISGVTDVESVAVGGLHFLFLKSDGSVWIWGPSVLGSDGSLYGYGVPPVRVPNLSNIQSIASYRDICVALDADGKVWAWERRELPRQVPLPLKATKLGKSALLLVTEDGTPWELIPEHIQGH